MGGCEISNSDDKERAVIKKDFWRVVQVEGILCRKEFSPVEGVCLENFSGFVLYSRVRFTLSPSLIRLCWLPRGVGLHTHQEAETNYRQRTETLLSHGNKSCPEAEVKLLVRSGSESAFTPCWRASRTPLPHGNESEV